jgi:hypothetical protein
VKKVAIIGAGAYGCYTVDAIQRRFPDAEITVFEVGNRRVVNEKEIGYASRLLGGHYTGLTDGRFFGFGGATAKWGGQLLVFSRKDFHAPDSFMRDIIEVDQKYAEVMFKKFKIIPDRDEPDMTPDLFVKTGVWLGYFNRNLFKSFRIGRRRNVRVIENTRVVKFTTGENGQVEGFEYLQDGNPGVALGFDQYFLTAGAFESVRILMSSGLMNKVRVPFSDHLSQRVFRIKGDTQVSGHDFAFKVRGASLITKRLIGEIDGVSFFANPIYNENFQFFQNLKKVMFQNELTAANMVALLKDFPDGLAFAWDVFVRKRIFVHQSRWDMNIDIENPESDSHISLSQKLDRHGVSGLDVTFCIGKKAPEIYAAAKRLVCDFLTANGVDFEECDADIRVEKSEDTYHPYGMFDEIKSLDDYYERFGNLLVVNTGVLPRAGGINTTASLFPVIEDFVGRVLA